MAVPRTIQERIEDSQKMLADGGDAWLASASEMGPHLVPLSLAWDQQQGVIIFCTEGKNRTARNIGAQGSVQVAVGSTRNVLMIHGNAELLGNVGDYPEIAVLFASKVGWDPRNDSGNWIFIRVTPSRMQAWREVNEIRGRTIMKNDQWLL